MININFIIKNKTNTVTIVIVTQFLVTTVQKSLEQIKVVLLNLLCIDEPSVNIKKTIYRIPQQNYVMLDFVKICSLNKILQLI